MSQKAQNRLVICETAPIAGARVGDGSPGLYNLCYERETGIIRTSVQGFWSVVDTDDYFERLAAYIDAGRRRTGSVRVLVDRRSSPVQSSEVGLRMQKANEDLYRPGDRLAIVVGSSLLKIQLGRLFRHEGSKAFSSYDEAVSWLKAL
jgi:hypothetical protein